MVSVAKSVINKGNVVFHMSHQWNGMDYVSLVQNPKMS